MQIVELTTARTYTRETKRLKIIDMLRGITILLVVSSHADMTPIWLNNLFRDFRMPLFFLVSGYLFSVNKYFYNIKLLLKTRLLSLILPYFSSAFLFYFIWLILQFSQNDPAETVLWYKPLFAIFYGIQPGGFLINGPIWFLNCLFVAQLLFCITLQFVIRLTWKLQCGIFLIIGLIGFLISKSIFLPWNIDVALVAQLFMFIGYKLKEYNILSKISNALDLQTMVIIIIFFIIASCNSFVDMSNRLYGNIFLFYFGGISGSFLVIKIIKILSNSNLIVKTLSFIGKNSLAILIFHSGFIIMIHLCERYFLGFHLNWLITTVIALIGSLLLNLIIERLPWLNLIFNGK